MTNEEIIDVVSAADAGMQIQERANAFKWWVNIGGHPQWNFTEYEYRVHPDDREERERIKAQMVPLEGKDWKIGDVVRKIASLHLQAAVVSINLNTGNIGFGIGTSRTNEEMQRDYERLNPATGEWVRCEKPEGGEA